MKPDVDVSLMNSDRVRRSLKRMVHEIVERNRSDRPIVFFGINKRGYALAEALGHMLVPMVDEKPVAIQLPIKGEGASKAFQEFEQTGFQEPFLVIVDDVIFSGQTMFSALKKITDRLTPVEIHTAALIDRGHRKFPIKAVFCGMELPTKLNEHVKVLVDGMEIEQVVLVNHD